MPKKEVTAPRGRTQLMRTLDGHRALSEEFHSLDGSHEAAYAEIDARRNVHDADDPFGGPLAGQEYSPEDD